MLRNKGMKRAMKQIDYPYRERLQSAQSWGQFERHRSKAEFVREDEQTVPMAMEEISHFVE